MKELRFFGESLELGQWNLCLPAAATLGIS